MDTPVLEIGIPAGEEKKYTFVWTEKINSSDNMSNMLLSAIDLDTNNSVNIYEDKGFSTYKNAVLIKNIAANKRYRLRLAATFGEETLVEHVYINGLDG